MSDLKNIKVLTSAAMLVAVAIVLGFFKLPIGPTLEIHFTSLPIAIAGALLGPIIGSIIGALSDIGAYVVKPTGPFFAGFTLSAAVTGFIFGIMLHKKKITWIRILAAQIIVTIIVGMVMNSFWLSMLFDKGFIVIMTSRIVKEVLMIPINTFILAVLTKALASGGIGMQKARE